METQGKVLLKEETSQLIKDTGITPKKKFAAAAFKVVNNLNEKKIEAEAAATSTTVETKSNENNKRPSLTQANANNRFKSELVRKNWKTVLDVAITKKNFENFENDSSLNAANNYQQIFLSEKFNWIFFAIIISILIILSFLFCSLVYIFFPQYRI